MSKPYSRVSDAQGATLVNLVGIMRRLLAPEGGCPWDREQTLASLRPYLVEEAYEVLESIDDNDPGAHREELGDLLFQIVFQAELRRGEGAFGIDDVVAAIVDKMVRRHPHVFAEGDAQDTSIKTADDQVQNWTKLKKAEGRGVLEGVPRALPALARAYLLGEKAARVGFDWSETSQVLAKVKEEISELEEAIAKGTPAEVSHELGDALLALTNLARFVKVHPEDALRAATQRFLSRFAHIETRLAAEGRSPDQATVEEMEVLWEEAKRLER